MVFDGRHPAGSSFLKLLFKERQIIVTKLLHSIIVQFGQAYDRIRVGSNNRIRIMAHITSKIAFNYQVYGVVSLFTSTDPMAATDDPKPLPANRNFLNHLEAFLARRDGVDRLLKITRYATKLILASSVVPETLPIHKRLKSFESSVGLSRKAFRLGKFVQDVNALRSSSSSSFRTREDLLLSIAAYGGEGAYYFVEQFVWLAKSGLIDPKHSRILQTISAWAELVGYLGSISLQIRDLTVLSEDEACLISSIEIAEARGIHSGDEEVKLKKLRYQKLLKRLSITQDAADWLMALADINNGRGSLSAPIVVSSAGLLSALISTHKNWISC